MNRRDDFPEEIKRILCLRVGGKCSKCGIETVGPHEDVNKRITIGQAAHITAASPGGPRFDPLLSPEERSSINNGIWLCNNCAKEVDTNPEKFSVEKLKLIKAEAEEKQAKLFGKQLDGMSDCQRDLVERVPLRTYFYLSNNENGCLYCTRCWDVDNKIVQVYCHGNGTYECPHCKNTGVYDEALFSQYCANQNRNRRQVISRGIM